MRNKYGGMCYRCGRHVEAGAGHFERFRGGWRVQHADCAIKHRGTPDSKREADRVKRLHWLAGQTGRKAQKARAELRLLKQEAGMADED